MAALNSTHGVRIENTRVGRALVEIAEDRLAEVFEHYQDAQATEKSSTVTIKIKITPMDERREQYDIQVGGSTSLSERNTYGTSLYAGPNEHGEIEAVEYNPRQMRMFSKSPDPDSVELDRE